MKALIALAVIFVSLFSVGNLLADDEGARPADILFVLADSKETNGVVQSLVCYVHKNGHYKVVSKGDKDTVVLREGDLTRKQVESLEAYLEYRLLNTLPRILNGDRTSLVRDEHVITLQWLHADKEYNFVSLYLPNGLNLEETEIYYAKSDSPDAIHVDRFASIVKTIKSLCFE